MRLPLFYVLCFCLLTSCGNSKNSANTLKISTEQDAATLDPRQVRDLPTVTLMNMFFEGLMRTSKDGKPELAVAERVDVSPDFKTYTFTLKDAQWSNGDPITAKDFEESWKSVLEPSFPAPNAYQLFVIKGAKEAKEGTLALEEVGVIAKDPRTLVVELENPLPYFYELVASYFYLPVHGSWRTSQNISNDPTKWVSNGPFKLTSWQRHHELVAAKNPNYWDADNVELSTISVMKLDENTALHMFEKGDLEWTGSPMCVIPTDAIAALKKEGMLKTKSGAGTHWFRLNTQQPPFDNVNMRRAFGLALDRKAIVEHVSQGSQIPATGIVPISFGLQEAPYYQDHDLKTAKELFNKALTEMGISADQLPTISLTYAQSERNHKIAQAVQQQWNNAFGIQVQLQAGESKFVSDKIRKLDYQIASGSWFADFQDPINFLEVFKYKTNRTNQTAWENPDYIQLLDKSAWIADPQERKALLSQAEQLLIQEMPVIPLFYSTFLYTQSPKVEGVYFSSLGHLDFKHAKLHPHNP